MAGPGPRGALLQGVAPLTSDPVTAGQAPPLGRAALRPGKPGSPPPFWLGDGVLGPTLPALVVVQIQLTSTLLTSWTVPSDCVSAFVAVLAAGILYTGVVQTVFRQYGFDFSRNLATLALSGPLGAGCVQAAAAPEPSGRQVPAGHVPGAG